MLGTLCGQVIPANPLSALKYGRCAMDEVKKAVELDPKSSNAWLSRGVGNYYLPEAFGGSVKQAIQDFDKAIQLDGKSAEAQLWRGIALRKAGNKAEAVKAIEQSLKLNPNRKWAKQRVEGTSAVVVGVALALLVAGGFIWFPGHTFLGSDTQIYMPILDRLADPTLYSKDPLRCGRMFPTRSTTSGVRAAAAS